MYIKAQIYSRSQIIFQNWRIALEYSATYFQELDNPKIHQQPMTGDYTDYTNQRLRQRKDMQNPKKNCINGLIKNTLKILNVKMFFIKTNFQMLHFSKLDRLMQK